MANRPVVNASPLIFLARAGLMDLLRLAGEEISVPDAVANELLLRGPDDVTVQALKREPWIRVVEAPEIPKQIQAWDLGDGESSVLAWAHLHKGTEAILDDLSARRCAASLDIPVRGTLGLVLVAKKRGHIQQARPILDSLRQTGMYLSRKVMDQALGLVGE